MKEIDKLAWLCLDGGRFLAVRSTGRELFYLPGGKREPGESDAAALIREVAEELSVALAPSSIRPAAVFRAPADRQPEGTVVKLSCHFAEFSGELRPAAEIAELRWLGPADRALCSPAALLALDWLQGQGLVR